MTEHSLTTQRARQFLLGQLSELDREHVEKGFICDPDAKELILMAEEELIEDYLEDNLAPDQKDQFKARCLTTPGLRRKVAITRLLRKIGSTETNSQPSTATPSTTPSKRPKPPSLNDKEHGKPDRSPSPAAA